ncbi:MAG TPA: hypothetical protein VK775_04715 [Chthoniobacterales bacterium]|nr:hypothetical protein [Chthoniobacterales bacterium]
MSIDLSRSLPWKKVDVKQQLPAKNPPGKRPKLDLLSRVRLFYGEVLINGGFYVL